MANRYGLGQADFDIVINDEQAMRQFVALERKARDGSAKIAAALKEPQKAGDNFAASLISVGKAATVAGLAIIGVQKGLEGLVAVIHTVNDANKELLQTQFELNATFKGAASEYTRFAESVAKGTKFVTSEIQQSITAFGVLQQNYALTSDQLKTLTLITTAYATKSGRDLVQSARDIQAAIRGEGEAVEKLGLTLGRDFVRNAGLMTEAQKKQFYTLSDSERAVIILAAAEKQASDFRTVITDRMKTDLVVYDNYDKALKEITQTLAGPFNVAFKAVVIPITKFLEVMNQVFKGMSDAEVTIAKFNAAMAITRSLFTGNIVEANAYISALERINRIREAQAAVRNPFPGETGFIGPTEKEAQDNEATQKQAHEAAKTRLRQALENQIRAIDETNKAKQREFDVAIKLENDKHDAIRAATQAEKHLRQETARDIRDGAKEAIEAERDAFNEAHEEKMDQLREAKEAALEAAQDTRDRSIQAIEVEKDAAEDAVKEQVRQLEIERDARKELSEETRDTALENIETEKEAAVDKVEASIAAAQLEKTELGRIATDIKEHALEELARELAAEEKAIEKQVKDADSLKDKKLENAETEKEGQLRRIEQVQEAREDDRTQEDRRIEDQRRAIESAFDVATQEVAARKKAIDEKRRLADRETGNERDQLKRVRELEDRSLDDRERAELRALANRDERRERDTNDEERAIRDATDTFLDELDRRADQQEELHRQAIRQIDAETDARLNGIEEQIRGVDALSKGFSAENKLKDLNLDLTVATNKGDITEANRIREQIRREQIQNSFESAREGLKIQKDAIKSEADARKDALNEENRLRKIAIDQEKDLVKDALETQLAAIKVRTDTITSSLETEKLLIKDRFDAAKRLLDDQRFAEDAQLQQRLQRLEDQRTAEDAQFEVDKKRIDDLRAAREAVEIEEDRALEDRRLKEDRKLDERKEAIENSYEHERDQIEATHQTEIDRLKESETATKATFATRKETIEDAYEDEKRRIDILYDDPTTGILARLRQQKETTQREYEAKAKIVRDTYEAEQKNIVATYDDEATGLIPALKRAMAAQVREYDARKLHVENTYKAEQKQIELTHDALIKAQEAMKRDAEKQYSARLAAVEVAYAAEQKAIYNTYDDPQTGLIARQQKAHDNLITALNLQKTAWNNWESDTKTSITGVMRELDNFVGKLDELEKKGLIAPGAGREKPSGSSGGTGGGSDGGGGASVAGQPYEVLFGYDQPYNGPFAGGAAWAGGPSRHRGIDLTLPPHGRNGGRGSAVGAFNDAYVETLTDESAGGKGIITRLGNGKFEYYGHFDSRSVKVGDTIKRGQQVGTLGASGLGPSNTPHLHYEVRNNPGGDPVGRTVDPRPYMQGLTNSFAGGENPFAGEILELRPFGPHGAVIIIRAKTQDWEAKARQIAREQGFSDPSLFARQMRHESAGFNPKVISGEERSKKGAIGIAQFMPSTAEARGINPFNPIESLKGAAKYMRQLERDYAGLHGNTGTRNALWAYNAGEGNLLRGIMPGETRQYLEILQGYKHGTMINEPTLMVGMNTGTMGIAGETGQPERLLGVAATSSYDGSQGPLQSVSVPVIIGDDLIQNVIITGMKLMVKSGRNIRVPGLG